MDPTINILIVNNVVKFPFTIGVLRPASCRVHIPRSRRWYLSISSCVAGRALMDAERSFRRLAGRGFSTLINPRVRWLSRAAGDCHRNACLEVPGMGNGSEVDTARSWLGGVPSILIQSLLWVGVCVEIFLSQP
jgi:hypothetical protein